MSNPKHPDISVRLTGQDGNAMVLIGAVRKALRHGGVPASEVTEFVNEAMSGDYNNVLTTCMEWVDIT